MTSFYIKQIVEQLSTKDNEEKTTYKYKLETKDKSVIIAISSNQNLNLFQGSFADLQVNSGDF